MNGSVYLSVCLSSCLLLIVKPWEDLKTGLLTGLQIRPHAFTCFNVKRTTDCLRSNIHLPPSFIQRLSPAMSQQITTLHIPYEACHPPTHSHTAS